MTPQGQRTVAGQRQEGQGPPNTFVIPQAAVCRGPQSPGLLVLVLKLGWRTGWGAACLPVKGFGFSWTSGFLWALTTQPAHLCSLPKPSYLPPCENPHCLSIPPPSPTKFQSFELRWALVSSHVRTPLPHQPGLLEDLSGLPLFSITLQCHGLSWAHPTASAASSTPPPLTARQDEVRRGQHDEGEGLEEAKVDEVGEEAHANHAGREALKNVEANQHSCGELKQPEAHSAGNLFQAVFLDSLTPSPLGATLGSCFSLTHFSHRSDLPS